MTTLSQQLKLGGSTLALVAATLVPALAQPADAPAPVEEVVPEPEPEAPIVEAAVPIRSQIDVLKIVTTAFDAVVKEGGTAFLPQISKEVKRLVPDLDFKDYGKSGLREFIEEFDDIFTVNKNGRNVYVSKRKGKRQARPISELVQ